MDDYCPKCGLPLLISHYKLQRYYGTCACIRCEHCFLIIGHEEECEEDNLAEYRVHQEDVHVQSL
jgi:uncharacterized Zn finger protein (UPF0148 family)